MQQDVSWRLRCAASAFLMLFLGVSSPCWAGEASESSDTVSDGPSVQAPVPLLLPPACTTAGYYYDDMVPYSFEDISTTGTNLNLTDDGEVAIPIGFNFDYYCTTYNIITVGGNGGFSFDDPLTSPNISVVNLALPAATSDFNTIVAGLWDDLDPGEAGAAVYYEVKGNAPNRRLIVQWNDVPHFPTSDPVTFEIILYETSNKILFQYKDVNFLNAGYDYGIAATVGIQKDSTTAVQYSFNTASLHDGMAILFTPYTELSSPTANTISLDYDCGRNGVWVGSDDGSGNIYLIDADSLTIKKTINLTGKVVATGGPGNNAISVLDNGNLLIADWNGDLAAIDDYLVEFNPDSETMVNYWPVDGAMNTSTDGTNYDRLTGIEMVFEPFRRAFLTQRGDKNVYEVALIPGKPGTWKTLATYDLTSTLTGESAEVEKVACYENTPIAGFAVSDYASTVVNFYDENMTLLSNFDAQHGGSTFTRGVTVVPGNPAKLWVTDFGTNMIAIFDTGEKCTMHCGKFPWHEIIGAISQGNKP